MRRLSIAFSDNDIAALQRWAIRGGRTSMGAQVRRLVQAEIQREQESEDRRRYAAQLEQL
jgi:hypothetical protein